MFKTTIKAVTVALGLAAASLAIAAPATQARVTPAAQDAAVRAAAGPREPCDIAASYHSSCVAAYSTTRALYGKYRGPLYRVRRVSDGRSLTVYPVKAGGAASTAPQNKFCHGTRCSITVIYDQSGHGNALTSAPGGTADGTADQPGRAGAAPVRVDGRAAYGVSITPGVGYRDDRARGTASGNKPEGIYEVVAGNHTNNRCCFDFGNAERGNRDDGSGHMEAIYYGSFPSPAGTAPSVKADTENGVPFSGGPTACRFTTAMLTDDGAHFQVLHGNASSGGLTAERDFSSPAHKEGAIVLGIGGDNSNWATGTFYEGIMTSRALPRAALNALQANIVAARYRP